MDSKEWLDETCARLDALDVEGFTARLTDDVWIRFGNAHPVHGRHAAAKAFGQLFASIGGMSHSIARVWEADDHLGLEAMVAYCRVDGSVIHVPTFVVWRLRGEQAATVQVFSDVAPVFAEGPVPTLCDGHAIDVVHQAGLESFPASDPPSWTPG